MIRYSLSQEESVLEEAAVLSRMSQSSVVSLLSLDSLPSYHYLVLEVRRSDLSIEGCFVANSTGLVYTVAVLYELDLV